MLYGRDEDIRDLVQCALKDIDTLLYGKSGIGKSSILNASVVPAARRKGYLPVIIRLSHKGQHSYLQQIKDGIATAMGISTSDTVEISTRIRAVTECKDPANESIYEYFHRHTFHDDNGERIKLLIIFDQFEEIFTLQKDEQKKKRFFAEQADFLNDILPANLQLTSGEVSGSHEAEVVDMDNLDDIFSDIDFNIDNEIPEYVTDNEIHMIFTIREDFLSEFEYYSSTIPSLKQNRYGLRPINEEQASQIILRPEPGLISLDVAKLIIEKVTGRSDFELDGIPEIEVDAAVLSLYLNRLYDAKRGNKITAELVEQKGGEIISDFYLDAISSISESSTEYLEDMLLNGQGRRDNITVYDAMNDGGVTEAELDILCNKKKILRQFNYAGDLRIEYVHDILCPVVKEHKDERLLLKQQEEERIRQEEEKQRLLLEEKAKREEIERKAEEEKARLQEEALKTRKRNRRRLFAIGAFALLLLVAIGGYFWYYEWEHVGYYAQFERVKGWPVGVGKELTAEERQHTPLYYKLSHRGHSDHDTDVEIQSSNGSLPLSPRIPSYEVSEADVNDRKAMDFLTKLSKISRIHFVEGENKNIDKEIAYDADGNILFAINYFHLPNGKDAWARYVTANGQELKLRDNGIDRMKLSWYINDDDPSDKNNGRIESFMYFDANGICRPAADSVCGYSMRCLDDNTVVRCFMDEYGRPAQTPFNVVTTTTSGDTTTISYAKDLNLLGSSPQPTSGPKGYTKEVTVGDITRLYGDTPGHIATLTTVRDKNGNKTSETIKGLLLKPYPTTINYAYQPSTGYLTEVEKLDADGKPFATRADSVYKKHWDYSDKGDIILEEHWNALGDKIYFHRIAEAKDIRHETIMDRRTGQHFTRIDSTLPDGKITCYFGEGNLPMVFKPIEGEDSLAYHKLVVKNQDGSKLKYYYTLDEANHVVPNPTVLDEYGQAISFFCKEEGVDNDGNNIYYRILDEDGKIVKSMMRYFQNGQPVARAVMGVDGYGHPVRCPDWEEEGFAYYKIYFSKDFNDKYITITSVDEWENPSIFYDPSSNTYQTIEYIDYKGAEMSTVHNGDTIQVYLQNPYSQYTIIPTGNLSAKSLPYLHILSKESSMYQEGLRDGDRIVRLGAWKDGMPEAVLEDEWANMYKNGAEISVLSPSVAGYERKTFSLPKGKPGREEYHVYALTKEELRNLKHFYSTEK